MIFVGLLVQLQQMQQSCSCRGSRAASSAAIKPSSLLLPLGLQARRAKSRKGRRTLGEEWMEHLIDRMEKEYTAELQVGSRACC